MRVGPPSLRGRWAGFMHSCGLHEPSREGRCLGGRGFGLGRRQRFQILEPSVPADENAAGRFDRGKPGSSGRSIGRFSHSGPAQELGLRVDLAASDRIVRCCACHRSASVRGGGLTERKMTSSFSLPTGSSGTSTGSSLALLVSPKCTTR